MNTQAEYRASAEKRTAQRYAKAEKVQLADMPDAALYDDNHDCYIPEGELADYLAELIAEHAETTRVDCELRHGVEAEPFVAPRIYLTCDVAPTLPEALRLVEDALEESHEEAMSQVPREAIAILNILMVAWAEKYFQDTGRVLVIQSLVDQLLAEAQAEAKS